MITTHFYSQSKFFRSNQRNLAKLLQTLFLYCVESAMDSFRSMCEPRDMAITLLLFYATALHRVITEMVSLPGYGFSPTNELIIDYVKRKRLDPDFFHHKIKEEDIYSLEPWDLIGKESSVYIFNEPYYKYNKSKRHHRRTKEGYWKVTGQGSKINANGGKRILSFYHRDSKTEWVMHEFYVEDDYLYKKDYVLCRIERKRDNKHCIPTNDEGQSNEQSVSYSSKPVTENTILGLQQPSNNLVSNRNLATENIFSKTQLLPIDTVISYSGNQAEENTLLESQQLSSDHLISSSRYHVADNGFPESQLPPNHIMISCSGNHVEDYGSLESQQLPNHNMISYYGNHVAGNGSSESQLLPNHNMVSHYGNHVAKNGSPKPLVNHNMVSPYGNHITVNACEESQQLLPANLISYRNHVANIASPEAQLIANQNMVSLCGNHIGENASPESQQLLPNHNLISDPRNQFAENTFRDLELLPNQHLDFYSMNNVVENTYNAEPLPLEELNAGTVYSGVNDASFSALQSPIYSEQGSSYTNGSNNGDGLLNSQFGSRQVNYLINSQRAFQNESSSEDSGQTLVPHFNSSELDAGVHGEDVCEMDIIEWEYQEVQMVYRPNVRPTSSIQEWYEKGEWFLSS